MSETTNEASIPENWIEHPGWLARPDELLNLEDGIIPGRGPAIRAMAERLCLRGFVRMDQLTVMEERAVDGLGECYAVEIGKLPHRGDYAYISPHKGGAPLREWATPRATRNAGLIRRVLAPAKRVVEKVRRAVAGWKVDSVCLADVEVEEVEWLWPSRMARGEISVLAGVGGTGKGLVTADMVARITTGNDWPDGGANAHGSVILCSAEDHVTKVMKPRVVAAGADPRGVHALVGLKLTDQGEGERAIGFTLENLRSLEALLDRLPDCRLVVIDPVGSFMGGDTDCSQDNTTRAILQPLAALARSRDVAVLLVCHYRKSGSPVADDNIMGSRAFTALARNVWHIYADPDNEDRRVMLAGKSNLGRPADGLGFVVQEVTIAKLSTPVPAARWEPEPLEMLADQWLAETEFKPKKRGPKPEKLAAAEEWLAGFFATNPVVPSKEVTDAARAAGFTNPKLLHAAREKLGFSCRREDPSDRASRWVWSGTPKEIIDAMLPNSRHAPLKPNDN
jgi:hypothetical protein